MEVFMKDEHRKDYVVGVYQVFDESKSFKDLQDFLKEILLHLPIW